MTTRDGVNRVVGTVHRTLFRLTKGRVGRRIRRAPVLLLTTIGRRTGKRRTWPLVYLEDGGRYVVVASNSGQDRDPAWYLNLVAQPEVEVELRDGTRSMIARTVPVEDRERLWPRLVGLHAGFDSSRRKSARPIPVVALMPPGAPEERPEEPPEPTG